VLVIRFESEFLKIQKFSVSFFEKSLLEQITSTYHFFLSFAVSFSIGGDQSEWPGVIVLAQTFSRNLVQLTEIWYAINVARTFFHRSSQPFPFLSCVLVKVQ
jgi:hypothetical protein